MPLAGGALVAIGITLLAVSQGASRLFRRPVSRHRRGPVLRGKAVPGPLGSAVAELVARGGIGFRKTLQGTVKSGDWAGDRITGVSDAGLLQLKCRPPAESFGDRPGNHERMVNRGSGRAPGCRAPLARDLPRLEYHERELCGHYPWLEEAVRDEFFAVERRWPTRQSEQNR